ncbi:competence protein CoiA [Litchfieldia salsa]|uniref:competence protein CoiA n=1 Tax=Litchfieldia salsa TaxID=930152 RepID=UPI001EE40190|nr:competence protein CoiA family protein [Litchfieldia salsa]
MALRKNGQFLSLLDHGDSFKLRALRAEESFYCPVCKEEVQLKIGKKKANHFSHYKNSSCLIQVESESETHLNGKSQLFNWLKEQYINTKLEPYIKSIAQRPDVLVEDHNQLYAIEFQCSRLSEEIFMKRTELYQEKNIQPLWIIDKSYLKCVGSHQYKMSPFLWQFVTKISNQTARIFFFSPDSNSIFQLSSIIPISPTLVFGHFLEMNLSNLTLYELLHYEYKFNLKQIERIWLQHKQRHRLQFSIYPQKSHRKLLTNMYQSRIAPSLMPPEIGLPCESMYWIHTHSFIWQLWIMLDCLFTLKVGDNITFKQVFHAFMRRVRTRDIIIRKLPLLKANSHVSYAVLEYLECLCTVGVLERKNKGVYTKVTEFSFPKSDEETFEADQKILALLFQESCFL